MQQMAESLSFIDEIVGHSPFVRDGSLQNITQVNLVLISRLLRTWSSYRTNALRLIDEATS